jgi:hypothetical protein
MDIPQKKTGYFDQDMPPVKKKSRASIKRLTPAQLARFL